MEEEYEGFFERKKMDSWADFYFYSFNIYNFLYIV